MGTARYASPQYWPRPRASYFCEAARRWRLSGCHSRRITYSLVNNVGQDTLRTDMIAPGEQGEEVQYRRIEETTLYPDEAVAAEDAADQRQQEHRKRTRDEVENLNVFREQARFSSSHSHTLRSPLTFVDPRRPYARRRHTRHIR